MQIKIYSIVLAALIITPCIQPAEFGNRTIKIYLRDYYDNGIELRVPKTITPFVLKHIISEIFNIKNNNLIFSFGTEIFFPGDYHEDFGSLEKRLAATSYIRVDSRQAGKRPKFSKKETLTRQLNNAALAYAHTYPSSRPEKTLPRQRKIKSSAQQHSMDVTDIVHASNTPRSKDKR